MTAAEQPLIRIEGASLSFRGRRVVDSIDLDLAAGETLALLGPNGAGKSSLMRLVAGRLAPEAGTVRIGGEDPFRTRSVRAGIGWVPQDIALYPRLSVAENLDVFARLSGIGGHERPALVRAALDLAEIDDMARRPVGLLSGGYQRRVNIAASLIGRPRLVLLDEPTQGVDLAARAAIHAVLSRLRADGAAILVATHDFAEVERLADRVAILSEGRLVQEGRLDTLLTHLRKAAPEHEVALASPPDTAAASALHHAGFRPVDIGLTWRASHLDGPDGAALLDVLREHGVPVSEVRIRAAGIETLYRAALASRTETRPGR